MDNRFLFLFLSFPSSSCSAVLLMVDLAYSLVCFFVARDVVVVEQLLIYTVDGVVDKGPGGWVG